MNKLISSCALACILVAGVAGSANAALLFQNNTPTGDTALPGSFDYTFVAPSATSAITNIQIQGYNTLDGQNPYEDDFTLSLNGTEIYHATFDLGGGGSNVVFTSPAGSTFTVTPTSTGAPTNAGGIADLAIPLSLASGSNTLTLSYASLQPPDFYGNQGIGDEGFGINSVSVSSVPLPASAPMFGAALLALGAVGYGVKRKKAAAAV